MTLYPRPWLRVDCYPPPRTRSHPRRIGTPTCCIQRHTAHPWSHACWGEIIRYTVEDIMLMVLPLRWRYLREVELPIRKGTF